MNEVLHIINEMAPFLLLGFLIAGVMHAFIPGGFYSKFLSKKNFRSVLNAALLGIPLPLCSCGVIPTAMSLRKEGASHGAVVSFLIATPQTGVDSISATYSLMGLPFAIVRPIAALFTALFGGLLANRIGSDSVVEKTEETETCCCHHKEKQHKEEEKSCCCHHKEEQEEVHDCCCHHAEADKGMNFVEKMKVALEYAFVDMMEDIGKWLIVGLIIAGLITVFVPATAFAIFVNNTWLSMLLVLIISIPMYVCATGSIPIAVALMMKGLTPGAGLVLLMAGPAANMASILVIRNRLGSKTLFAYLLSIVAGAVLFGCVIDFALPTEWFGVDALTASCCEESTVWWQWVSTAVLSILLINALVINKFVKGKADSCCCNTH